MGRQPLKTNIIPSQQFGKSAHIFASFRRHSLYSNYLKFQQVMILDFQKLLGLDFRHFSVMSEIRTILHIQVSGTLNVLKTNTQKFRLQTSSNFRHLLYSKRPKSEHVRILDRGSPFGTKLHRTDKIVQKPNILFGFQTQIFV